jgi:hypothetical protein
MLDKRKLKRRHLIYYLRVYDMKSKNSLGFMADIHSKGIMLISDEPIETNKVFDLRMELPQKIGKKTYLEFSDKSLWSKKGINSDFNETELSFEKIDEDSISTIESIIKFFGFKD